MVTITNNVITIRVSEGAYRNYFKRRGFHTVNGAERPEKGGMYPTPPENGTQQDGGFSQQETDDEDETEEDEEETDTTDLEEPDEDEEEEEDDDLSEIPLSDMNKEQLCAYAERLGLDPGDLTKKEIRELIREHLEK